MPGVCTSATGCHWCREPVTRCQMSQASLVTKMLTNVTSRNCRECSFSWKIREKMSKVYKVPVATISRPLVKENREWLDRDKTGRELVLFIKDELRKTWLALDSVANSSAVTMYILNMILTFRICLPPSEPGLPETKWNSISGWSRLLLVNLVDTQARPCNDSELVNIFILIVNFIIMGILNNEGIVCRVSSCRTSHDKIIQ